MTDASMKQTRFMISQMRTKNIWRELELISILFMIIFVSSLLPSLLLRYVYTDPQMMETPPVFELIPVFSFVLGVAVFVFVIVSNLMREMKAQQLEKMLEGGTLPSPSASTKSSNNSSSDLQAAMKSLSTKSAPKKKTKVVAAQKASTTKTKKASKRKSK